jgi:antitoxin (DNA-binding transcriptional repressor) of toxin-antitoxin stability system
MLTVNIHEAKMHLSRLVDRAAKGERFIIAKAGQGDAVGNGGGQPGSPARLLSRANRRTRRFRPEGQARDQAAFRQWVVKLPLDAQLLSLARADLSVCRPTPVVDHAWSQAAERNGELNRAIFGKTCFLYIRG